MATFSKVLLSGSTGGRPIPISATGGTGSLIHTTGVTGSIKDEIWLYATNLSGGTESLYLTYGGSATGDQMTVGVPALSGLSIVLPGTILTGNNTTGSEIRATASRTNVINVTGYVNRIEP